MVASFLYVAWLVLSGTRAKLKEVGGFRRLLADPLSGIADYQYHSGRGRKSLTFIPSLLDG
jgi:hypothetical protein